VAASQVAEELAVKRQWTLATVRTLLRRLMNKGLLEQQTDGKRFWYTPRASMAECVRQESESFLDRVLGRTPPATILQLVKRAELSSEDIEELRKILRKKEKES